MKNNKLNLFFQNIFLKKQYINKLKNKIFYLNNNKTSFNVTHINQYSFLAKQHYLVKYIIDITFSETNTLLHVMDFSGNLKFFCSAGNLSSTKKQKKARWIIFKDFYKILISKLKFLKYQPIALHLKNVKSEHFRIIKRLKKKFYIKNIKLFNSFSYNGCRKKKIRRKKIRTKKQLKIRRNG